MQKPDEQENSSQTEATPGSGSGSHGRAGEESGFTLAVALLVMALLTVLGLTMMFTADTERNISRNVTGQVQASYAAEGMVEAMVQALLLDLKYDENGWANRYMVVCEFPAASACVDEYGFNPTQSICAGAGCVVQDTTGVLTGRKGQWVADLTYRCVPNGSGGCTTEGVQPAVNLAKFPSQIPVRLDPRFRTKNGANAPVMPWWEKFNVDLTDTDRLNSASADIALTSSCTGGCTGATPVYDPEELTVTGIGKAAQSILGQVSRIRRAPSRSIGVRVHGEPLDLWGNALVGGDGAGQTDVVTGDYLIRGSVLQFNTLDDKVVMRFASRYTGVVNNWYGTEATTADPTIDGWWWKSARGCGTARCDSNDTAGVSLDSNSSTETKEAISHHLPDPPDLVTGDAWPGGYRADRASQYPGPEGLESKVRLRAGKIVFADTTVGLGREEPGAARGNFWDNILEFLASPGSVVDGSYPPPPGNPVPAQVWRDLNQHDRNGDFDASSEQFKFPSLDDAYLEPATREQYANYFDFLRPADTSAATGHPGGWALDMSGLTGVDSDTVRNLDRNVRLLQGTTDLDCWPVGGIAASPTVAQIKLAFGDYNVFGNACYTLGASNPSENLRLNFNVFGAAHPNNCSISSCKYAADFTTTGLPDSAEQLCGETFTDGGCASNDPYQNHCIIRLKKRDCSLGGATQPCPTTNTTGCPNEILLRIYKRQKITSYSADGSVVLDTSSSIDAPKYRAKETMYDSFAYKVYLDVLKAVDGCNPANSTLYSRNLVNLPAAFKVDIPTQYLGIDNTKCRLYGVPPTEPSMPVCFRERSAYMDVHIQLPDLPVTSVPHGVNTNCPTALTTPNTNPLWWAKVPNEANPMSSTCYPPTGRWLSVRFRPSGTSAGSATMTVLNDPRAGFNVGAGLCATDNPYTDIADEIVEVENPAMWRYRIKKTPVVNGINLWSHLNIPRGYDRARAMHSDDTTFRNMPTGAFVIAMHLPCSTDPDDLNPYKCTQGPGSYSAPAIAYDGYFTHLIGWAPKYSCWRTHTKSWDQNQPTDYVTAGPPSRPNAYNCSGGPVCPTNNLGSAWFAESLYQANQTTLRNETARNFPNGEDDTSHDGSGNPNHSPQPTLSGFKLMVPILVDNSAERAQVPCRIGLDRRTETAVTPNENCASATKVYGNCGIDLDGEPCNGNWCAAMGCTGTPPTTCQNEPDFVKGACTGGSPCAATSQYGGCNEIFTPLVTFRTPGMDPDVDPWRRQASLIPSPLCDVFVPVLCKGGLTECAYKGIDPDAIGGWSLSRNANAYAIGRYDRGWPGFSSASVLETAGLIMFSPTITGDKFRFGSPARGVGPSPRYTDNLTLYNPPLVVGDKLNGFYSDPIIYDGRAIIYVGPERNNDGSYGPASTTNTLTYYHDSLVPRGRMGCSDFLSVLTYGNTEIRYEMLPLGNTTGAGGKQLLALYNLTQSKLLVTTPGANLGHELAGAWVANGAAFGTYSPPVQLIGAPEVAGKQCDHIFLPGRDPLPQRVFMSYVEDETIPPSN